jgi:3-oxoacid CoA-transferase subunit A
MIFITGDVHGSAAPIESYYNAYISKLKTNEEIWIVLLGDSGLNYNNNKTMKNRLRDLPLKFFVVRGNHEDRAYNCAMRHPNKWSVVKQFNNYCLVEDKYPNIYYAMDDGGIYMLETFKVLVIPGAYSVDKYYRLENYGPEHWFPEEQLDAEEMYAFNDFKGHHFDFVFSHTCPFSWQPFDKFLPQVDQSTVDNSMERWLDEFKNDISFTGWCFGHYHDDRYVRPGVIMFLNQFEEISNLYSFFINKKEPNRIKKNVDLRYYAEV